VQIGKISLEQPEGWVTTDLEIALPPGVRGVCVAPVGNAGPSFEGCSGVMVFSGDPLPGYQGAPYEQDKEWQFAYESGPIPCPSDDPPGSTLQPGPAGLFPINQGLRDVGGGKRAAYNRWFARCGADGAEFYPEAWLLPQSQILIVDMFGHEETEALLASAEFGQP
jgi:hypothetical protein